MLTWNLFCFKNYFYERFNQICIYFFFIRHVLIQKNTNFDFDCFDKLWRFFEGIFNRLYIFQERADI